MPSVRKRGKKKKKNRRNIANFGGVEAMEMFRISFMVMGVLALVLALGIPSSINAESSPAPAPAPSSDGLFLSPLLTLLSF